MLVVFLRITLPYLKPALIGAAIFCLLLSFDDFVRSFFLGGYEPTLACPDLRQAALRHVARDQRDLDRGVDPDRGGRPLGGTLQPAYERNGQTMSDVSQVNEADASADVVVHIDRVTKRFGDITAVDNLDMKILAGEFVTFLGPSGCGKSTTLRILGGFETADEGRVILDGVDVTSLPPNKRDVNMVFQDYALFPHMTVAQNMAFGLELKGISRADIDKRLSELMAFLELEALGERMPDQLSGGQRQRVALARRWLWTPGSSTG